MDSSHMVDMPILNMDVGTTKTDHNLKIVPAVWAVCLNQA